MPVQPLYHRIGNYKIIYFDGVDNVEKQIKELEDHKKDTQKGKCKSMVEVNFEFKTNDPWSNSVNEMTLCYYRSHINFQPI